MCVLSAIVNSWNDHDYHNEASVYFNGVVISTYSHVACMGVYVMNKKAYKLSITKRLLNNGARKIIGHLYECGHTP